MSEEKNIDEAWKNSISNDQEGGCGCQDESCDAHHSCSDDCSCGGGEMQVNFFTYITSMGYQAMIFLGEVPHPATNQIEQNIQQAKFLIDTLAMIKDKTKGNLTPQEDQFLSGTVYELQMKYVEVSKGNIIQP